MSEAHFGRWIERLRHRIGIKSQAEFAELLGLESREAIYHMQLRKGRGISGVALESLLDILGVQREEDLDAFWKSGTFPDMGEVRERVRQLKPGLVIYGVRAGSPVMAMVEAEVSAEAAARVLATIAELADGAGISDDEVITYFRKKKARSVPGIRTGTDQAKTPKAAAHHSDAARRRVEEKRRRPR